ncbi:MAG: hypothetical protein M3256_24705, partial [Actinomycetota bacterium]|nr:hypothetical protein [Actinomycetota bacterium]
LGGSPTLSVNLTVNSANGLKSCSITLAGVGSQPCAQGQQNMQFTVPLNGGSLPVQGSVQDSLGQTVSNMTIGSAATWGVSNSALNGNITLGVNFRAGPGTNYGINSSGHLPPTGIPEVCQTQGTLEYFVPSDHTSPSSSRWDKMSNGDWVADIYVNPVSVPPC